MGYCLWTHVVIQVIEVYLSAYIVHFVCLLFLSGWYHSSVWKHIPSCHSVCSTLCSYLWGEIKPPLLASCTHPGRPCQDIKSFCEKNNWSKVKKTSYLQPRHTPPSLSLIFHLALKAMFVPREEYHLFFLDPIFIKQTPHPCILQRRWPAGCSDMRKISVKYNSPAVLFSLLLHWFSISKYSKSMST